MSHVTVITEVWTSTSDRRLWTRRGIRAEQRGDNSDRGMQRWNGLETPLLKVEIDTKLMTEWDKLNRHNRNNGAPIRTKLNTTVWPIHSPPNTSYTLTRVYVLLLVCDMFPQIVSSEGACYWGERQPDRRGSGRGLEGWGGDRWCCWSVSLFLSLSLYRITPSLSWSSAQPELPKLLVSSSLLLPEEKSCGSFFGLCQKVSEGQTPPIHPSDEWTGGKQQSEDRRKKKKTARLSLLWAHQLSGSTALR